MDAIAVKVPLDERAEHNVQIIEGVRSMGETNDGTGGMKAMMPMPAETKPVKKVKKAAKKVKKAVKCDMCKDQAGGAACVRACPTGAAIRVAPEEFLTVTRLEKA